MWQNILKKKYYIERNDCNQTLKIWKMQVYSSQSNPNKYKKANSQAEVQARLPCHHTT